jgi:FixJ family two-component response regulator
MRLISIVDDDPSVRRAVQRMVEAAGYSAETFASAGEFLRSAPRGRTACLVLDLDLGGITGLDLQQCLAADGAGIPIVFITAADDCAARARAIDGGAAAYLHKPFDAPALLEAITRALRPA